MDITDTLEGRRDIYQERKEGRKEGRTGVEWKKGKKEGFRGWKEG